MSSTTTRLGLYLPGGGSTGAYGADETADIDKLNANFSKLDGAAYPTVGSLAALIALTSTVPVGAIVNVLPFTISGSMTMASVWQKQGAGYWKPVHGSVFMVYGDSNTADLQAAGTAFFSILNGSNGTLFIEWGQRIVGQSLTSNTPNSVCWVGNNTWQGQNLFLDPPYASGWTQWDPGDFRSILKRDGNVITAALNFRNVNVYGSAGGQSGVNPFQQFPADFRPARINTTYISIYVINEGWVGTQGQFQIGIDGNCGINYLSRQIPAGSLHCVTATYSARNP